MCLDKLTKRVGYLVELAPGRGRLESVSERKKRTKERRCRDADDMTRVRSKGVGRVQRKERLEAA